MNMPDTHAVELAPADLKRPCCGMLKIQPHSPDCTGEIRPRRRATTPVATATEVD